MFESAPIVTHVRNKIASHGGVESAGIGKDGAINVVLRGGINRDLREEILDIGRRAMVPVRVFYRMPDGAVIGESRDQYSEWVNDYYKDIKVAGFANDVSDAPPEEVAAQVDGAQKLKRIRAKTRGRPVVAWRVGDKEFRKGVKVSFTKEASLQWTMGRTLNVQPGAIGRVDELSSRRPIAFIRVGEYAGIELPIHALNHFFTILPQTESVDEAKKAKKDSGVMGKDLEFGRIMNAIGLGKPVGWGRDPAKDDVPENEPFFRDQWITRDPPMDDDVEIEEFEVEDDMLEPDPDDMPRPSHKHKALILGKR